MVERRKWNTRDISKIIDGSVSSLGSGTGFSVCYFLELSSPPVCHLRLVREWIFVLSTLENIDTPFGSVF